MIYDRKGKIDAYNERREKRRPEPKERAGIKKNPYAKPLKYFSAKREKKQRAYRNIVSDMIAEDPTCHVKSPVCNNEASGLQHKVKRSEKNLCDPDNLLRCCTPCQTWIEENPLKAIAMGVSKSKF